MNPKLILLLITTGLSCLADNDVHYTKEGYKKPGGQVANEIERTLKTYNPVWSSQSKDSSESMPVGGGDIGLNVWVENGELLFYLSRSGTFDENMTMLKLGRARVKLSPNPFEKEKPFRQELKLRDGYIQIDGEDTRIKVWVEVFRPVIHLEAEGKEKFDLLVSYESWRDTEHPLSKKERTQCLSFLRTDPKHIPLKTHTDTFDPQLEHMLWYHRNDNRNLVFDKEIEQQHLSPIKDQFDNPLKNLTFGGLLRGSNLQFSNKTSGQYLSTPYTAWNYKTTQAAKKQDLEILLHVEQSDTLQQWKHGLEKLAAEQVDTEELAEKSRLWWNAYWERSFIAINSGKADPQNKGWQIARNYQLFRYMLGCNAYGKYPTKFNGGLFTYDPQLIKKGPKEATPDFRMWGGGSFTAQNQRLVYWPMLKSGDFDMMKPQFDYYKNALKNAELRTEFYYGHKGASFSEQISFYGLPIGDIYEYTWGKRGLGPRIDSKSTRTLTNLKGETIRILDKGYLNNRWVSDHYDTVLEFCKMILDQHRFNGTDISEYLPLIHSCISFLDQHYQYWSTKLNGQPLNDQGKLTLYPATACETYKTVTNPANLIAGMMVITQRLLEMPDNFGSPNQRAYWQEISQRIPAIPFRTMEGKKVIAPALKVEKVSNQELPFLYPVFPWGLYGLGKPDLQVAIDSWHFGADAAKQYNHISWHQDAIFCARLGLIEEAKERVILKLEDAQTRFPVFWGPGHDWVPDHNWGGSGMIALQEMLMQTSDREIRLLPAWPKEWNVDFKLHAPYNTTVEGKLREGEITELKVTPESRRKDIVFTKKSQFKPRHGTIKPSFPSD
jgi:hypothetical protein